MVTKIYQSISPCVFITQTVTPASDRQISCLDLADRLHFNKQQVKQGQKVPYYKQESAVK